MKCVIDTHVWISALSSHSPFHWVVEALIDERFDLYIAHDILLEYEEKLKEKYNFLVAENFLRSLRELPNVYQTDVFFQWHLLDDTDPDDNKFVDAAFACNAHYLVSDDKHYNPLDRVDFPKIKRIRLAEFQKIFEAAE